ncbi:hypothetical protein BHE74_00023181 [Ensete ventricosum]|nr:hypothetical protein BHE74_00023181 [Ensete ventricosum]
MGSGDGNELREVEKKRRGRRGVEEKKRKRGRGVLGVGVKCWAIAGKWSCIDLILPSSLGSTLGSPVQFASRFMLRHSPVGMDLSEIEFLGIKDMKPLLLSVNLRKQSHLKPWSLYRSVLMYRPAIGKTKGDGEGELDHHVVGSICEGAGEDEVRGSGDEDVQEEEERVGDHCMPTVELIDAHPPEAGPETPELGVNAGEVACV